MSTKQQRMRFFLAICGCFALLGTPMALGSPASEPSAAASVKRTQGSAFDGDGMWIWIAKKSNGGSPDAIAARAKASGIETIFLKSGDGTSMWSQFSPSYVSALKQRGLRVCAWQYVYGRSPTTEAKVSARAVKNGADCFVIDAEGEYEGKYTAALTYMRKLRSLVGESYPIGLAAFPYVDYHPAFPYSVFMGPGGAQFNLPQMYWRAIGVSVNAVISHTYLYNRVYKRPVAPLGQVYMNPSGAELNRFRVLSAANGATGVSWWDWQEAKSRHWRALATPLPEVQPSAATPTKGYPPLKKGSRGDLVLWAQEHLIAAGNPVAANGLFRDQTATAVNDFRAAHGLAPGTTIDNATWTKLLEFTPDPAAFRKAKSGRASAASAHEPASASLPAVRNELSGKRH